MGFNVWRDGEIHPTAVLAISGLASKVFPTCKLEGGFLDVIKVLLMPRGVCCPQSLQLPVH